MQRNRIREQLQVYGPTELSTLDLLAFVLEQHPDPRLRPRLAHLLEQYAVQRLRQASVAELQQAGLTRMQAQRLVALGELTRRLAVLEVEPLPRIHTSGDAVAILRPLMAHLDQETFRVLVLNRKHRVVENLELYRGTIDSAEVRIAEILRPAVMRKASALLVAHNHPSGDPEPSERDREMTWQLVQAAHLLDVHLVDHLIIGNPRCLSLRSLLNWT
jgi:DNA repair protein RadC